MRFKNFITNIINDVIIRRTSGIFIISILSSVAGFFIPLLIAYYFGITKETDSFFLSYNIVLFGASIFQGVISGVIVPFIVERKNDEKMLHEFVNSTFIFIGLLVLVLTLLGYAVLNLFQAEMDDALFQYMQILLPLMFLLVINSISKGILNSLEFFYYSESSQIIRIAAVYIFLLSWQDVLGLKSLLSGYLAGEIFITIYFSILLNKKIGFSIKKGTLSWSEFREFFNKGAQQFIGSSIIGATPLVDRFVASTLAIGSVSILDYGEKLFSVFTVLYNGFLIVILTHWSNQIALNKNIFGYVRGYIKYIFFISSFIVIITVLFSEQIVSMLYGSLAENNKELILSIFRINTVSFIFISVMQILNRAIIAGKMVHLIMRVAIIKSVFNLIFDIIFAYFFQVKGIAVASLLNHMLGFFIMYYLFKKEIIKAPNYIV